MISELLHHNTTISSQYIIFSGRKPSGPKTRDPYENEESPAMLPIFVAIGAFIPLVFCMCKLWWNRTPRDDKSNLKTSNMLHCYCWREQQFTFTCFLSYAAWYDHDNLIIYGQFNSGVKLRYHRMSINFNYWFSLSFQMKQMTKCCKTMAIAQLRYSITKNETHSILVLLPNVQWNEDITKNGNIRHITKYEMLIVQT